MSLAKKATEDAHQKMEDSGTALLASQEFASAQAAAQAVALEKVKLQLSKAKINTGGRQHDGW